MSSPPTLTPSKSDGGNPFASPSQSGMVQQQQQTAPGQPQQSFMMVAQSQPVMLTHPTVLDLEMMMGPDRCRANAKLVAMIDMAVSPVWIILHCVVVYLYKEAIDQLYADSRKLNVTVPTGVENLFVGAYMSSIGHIITYIAGIFFSYVLLSTAKPAVAPLSSLAKVKMWVYYNLFLFFLELTLGGVAFGFRLHPTKYCVWIAFVLRLAGLIIVNNFLEDLRYATKASHPNVRRPERCRANANLVGILDLCICLLSVVLQIVILYLVKQAFDHLGEKAKEAGLPAPKDDIYIVNLFLHGISLLIYGAGVFFAYQLIVATNPMTVSLVAISRTNWWFYFNLVLFFLELFVGIWIVTKDIHHVASHGIWPSLFLRGAGLAVVCGFRIDLQMGKLAMANVRNNAVAPMVVSVGGGIGTASNHSMMTQGAGGGVGGNQQNLLEQPQ